MRSISTAVLDTGHRVQRFLDANAGVLATANASGARTKLNAAVLALESHANELESKKQQGVGETGKQRELRQALLKLMRSINRIGRMSLADVPDFSPLRMPSAKVNKQTLIEKAYAMGQAAAPHAQVFVDGGLPADFLNRLQAAANAIAASVSDRNDTSSARVVATGGTVEETRKARQAMHTLDALVKLALPADDLLLVGWASAKRYHAVRTVSQPASTGAVVGGTDAGAPATSTAA